MNIKTAILNVLKNCGDYALFKNILKVELETRIGGKVGDGEFSDALVALKSKGWIDTRLDDVTDDTRYFITNTGKTKVSQ